MERHKSTNTNIAKGLMPAEPATTKLVALAMWRTHEEMHCERIAPGWCGPIMAMTMVTLNII
eukprot:14470517-Alexandrium_andersonii.AAC.1